MAKKVQCPNCGGYKTTEHTGCSNQNLPFHIIATIITLGVWLAMLAILALISGPPEKTAPGVHSYTCELCGYKWHWKEGTPLPIVRKDQNLMELGEKKRREDERRWDD